MSLTTGLTRSGFRLPPSVALLWLLPLAFLWYRLIDHLRIEWAVNPAYGYGWAVPILCAYLVWQRITKSVAGGQRTESGSQRGLRFLPSVFCLLALAFLYGPTRLVQEANPEWRLISWALALIVIGLTWLLVCLMTDGRSQKPEPPSVLGHLSSALIFPIFFFLVAVPWPTVVEGRLIQWLTGANVALTIELLNTFGIPALQHGNVIEVTTGVVGVDEACSGIRSFQATLMISLFFGELYRLSALRRTVLCFLGFALSFVFNVGRTFILTYVAAKQGVPAIEKWHDPAGVTVLVWCFVALWFASLVLRGGQAKIARTEAQGAKGEATTDSGGQKTEDGGPLSPVCPPSSALHLQPSALALGLILWLILVEVGVEWWYRSHERHAPAAVVWNAAFPTDNDTFRELPLTEKARQFLRYDEGRNCAWREDDGTRWQGIYLRWNPGKIAVHLASSHTPEVCLSAAGRKMTAKSDLRTFEAGGLQLPFFAYVFEGPQDRVHVFYCLWEDRAAGKDFDTESLTYGKRLAPVLAGRRNSGQRTLELAVWGIESQEQAAAAMQRQLKTIVRLKPD